MKPVRFVGQLGRGFAALVLTALTIALLVIAPAQVQVGTQEWQLTALNAIKATLTAERTAQTMTP